MAPADKSMNRKNQGNEGHIDPAPSARSAIFFSLNCEEILAFRVVKAFP